MTGALSQAGSGILVIEDNDINMDLMIYILNAMGHSVIPALNGPAGLAIARAQRPALILCDIQMPELDGLGVLRALKGDRSTRDIPIVAITSQAMVGDREKLMGAGFDGYLSKPIEFDDLRLEVEKHLTK